MKDLEMRLGKEISELVEKDNIVVFRSETTNQPYVLIKLKDEAGAVANFGGNGLYMIKAKDYESKEEDY